MKTWYWLVGSLMAFSTAHPKAENCPDPLNVRVVGIFNTISESMIVKYTSSPKTVQLGGNTYSIQGGRRRYSVKPGESLYFSLRITEEKSATQTRTYGSISLNDPHTQSIRESLVKRQFEEHLNKWLFVYCEHPLGNFSIYPGRCDGRICIDKEDACLRNLCHFGWYGTSLAGDFIVEVSEVLGCLACGPPQLHFDIAVPCYCCCCCGVEWGPLCCLCACC